MTVDNPIALTPLGIVTAPIALPQVPTLPTAATITPLGTRVLVRVLDAPAFVQFRYLAGQIVSVGSGVVSVAIGDAVLFFNSSSFKIDQPPDTLYLIDVSDIAAKLS